MSLSYQPAPGFGDRAGLTKTVQIALIVRAVQKVTPLNIRRLVQQLSDHAKSLSENKALRRQQARY